VKGGDSHEVGKKPIPGGSVGFRIYPRGMLYSGDGDQESAPSRDGRHHRRGGALRGCDRGVR